MLLEQSDHLVPVFHVPIGFCLIRLMDEERPMRHDERVTARRVHAVELLGGMLYFLPLKLHTEVTTQVYGVETEEGGALMGKREVDRRPALDVG